MNKKIKIYARYVLLLFFMLLAYTIIQPEYVVKIKDVGEIATASIYTSVFGALTFILKSHFETKVEKD